MANAATELVQVKSKLKDTTEEIDEVRTVNIRAIAEKVQLEERIEAFKAQIELLRSEQNNSKMTFESSSTQLSEAKKTEVELRTELESMRNQLSASKDEILELNKTNEELEQRRTLETKEFETEKEKLTKLVEFIKTNQEGRFNSLQDKVTDIFV